MTYPPPKTHLRLGFYLFLGLIMLSLLPPAPARAEAGRLAQLEAGWGAAQKDLGGLKVNLFARTPRSGSQRSGSQGFMLSLLPPAPARAEVGRLAQLEAGCAQKDLGGLRRPQRSGRGLKANLFARTPRSGRQGSGSQVQELAITLAVGIVSLVVVVYLLVRRYRRQDVDEEEVEDEAGEEEGEEELK